MPRARSENSAAAKCPLRISLTAAHPARPTKKIKNSQRSFGTNPVKRYTGTAAPGAAKEPPAGRAREVTLRSSRQNRLPIREQRDIATLPSAADPTINPSQRKNKPRSTAAAPSSRRIRTSKLPLIGGDVTKRAILLRLRLSSPSKTAL